MTFDWCKHILVKDLSYPYRHYSYDKGDLGAIWGQYKAWYYESYEIQMKNRGRNSVLRHALLVHKHYVVGPIASFFRVVNFLLYLYSRLLKFIGLWVFPCATDFKLCSHLVSLAW